MLAASTHTQIYVQKKNQNYQPQQEEIETEKENH